MFGGGGGVGLAVWWLCCRLDNQASATLPAWLLPDAAAAGQGTCLPKECGCNIESLAHCRFSRLDGSPGQSPASSRAACLALVRCDVLIAATCPRVSTPLPPAAPRPDPGRRL